ncbi:MAG: hypothetical protein RIN55_05265 [Tissierellaceae bacterium]|nr:hypothetical protein [Tissierellaceae bacterium]
MKKVKMKILIVLIIILSISLISACTQNNNDTNDNNTGQDTQDGQNGNNGTVVVPPNPDQDVDLTQRLLDDEDISDGQIYIRDEWAIGAIILEDNVSKDRAQEIAQQYAEEIKNKYNDKKVNVQVILNGENVANIEL